MRMSKIMHDNGIAYRRDHAKLGPLNGDTEEKTYNEATPDKP